MIKKFEAYSTDDWLRLEAIYEDGSTTVVYDHHPSTYRVLRKVLKKLDVTLDEVWMSEESFIEQFM